MARRECPQRGRRSGAPLPNGSERRLQKKTILTSETRWQTWHLTAAGAGGHGCVPAAGRTEQPRHTTGHQPQCQGRLDGNAPTGAPRGKFAPAPDGQGARPRRLCCAAAGQPNTRPRREWCRQRAGHHPTTGGRLL